VRDLQAFATWLAEEQYTPGQVLMGVRVPKVDEIPAEPFSDEELAALFDSLDTTDALDLRNYVIMQTLWDAGMHMGEPVALTLDDIDL
jgi:site-specific recombinase XerD